MLSRWMAGATLGLALTTLSAARAEDPPSGPLPEPRIVLPVEATGQWRTRSQPVFDALRQELRRRPTTVWDPRPSLGLVFSWTPDRPAESGRERATGPGRLVWRLPDRPSYDPAAFVAEYVGTLRNGRPDGEGLWRERSGLSYEGSWVAGRPSGKGRLLLPGGAEYLGAFRAGVADGEGRVFDGDGEIFEGTFRDGLRDGIGRTVLPNGASYRSEWARGEEKPGSRTVRLAQMGPVRGPADDVRLGVSVERVDDENLLQYAATNTDTALVIEPSKKRLMAVWKGEDDIQLTSAEESVGERGSYGLFAWAAGDLPPLTLVVEVQNRSTSPVAVKGAYLDVEESVSDLQPAIQLTGGTSGECNTRSRADYSPQFDLENYGWSPAENASLRFAFAKPRTTVSPNAPTVTKPLGLLRTSMKVDMEPELRAAGVKIDQLKRRSESGGIACKAKGNGPACLAEIAASGLFGTLSRAITLQERDIFLHATGTLSYGWKDQKGADRSRSSPFTARILLGRTPVEAECGEGAEKDPVGKKPLSFRLDQKGYRLPVAFERTIPAGRSARYTVSVQAAKASEHSFKVVLQTASGQQISSRPIALTYFRPSRLQKAATE